VGSTSHSCKNKEGWEEKSRKKNGGREGVVSTYTPTIHPTPTPVSLIYKIESKGRAI